MVVVSSNCRNIKITDVWHGHEAFTSGLLENSPNPIQVLSGDTSVIYVNHAFEELTGFSAAEVLGKQAPHPWWTVETICKTKSGLLKILRVPRKAVKEIFQKKNGEKFVVQINSRPIEIEGKFSHLLANWTDITELEKSENALRESEQFNASLLNNSPIPVLVLKPDTGIQYVNPALEELTGFMASELIGKTVPYPWWIEEDVEKAVKQMKEAMLLGERKVERRIRRKNGELVWIQITSTSVKQDGKIKYHLSNWVNITERKEAEERLVKINEELRSLSAHLETVREGERTRIAREIHDELGQALASLKMDIYLISNNLTKDQDNLRELTATMAKLIDITVQRIKRLCIELRPKLLDDIGIGGTIEWLAAEFQKATGIRCSVTCTLSEKALDEERTTAIFRIYQEALTNVYRHAKATRVSILLNKVNGMAVLRVSDNGVGLSRDKISSPQSFGLIGIRERLHYFGGDLQVKRTRNSTGATLIARIPLSGRRSS